MAGLESAPQPARGSQDNASGVQWHELKTDADLQAAMQEAAQKHEPFVLEIGATWCAACKIMDKELAQDSGFNGLAGQAVFARLEADKYKLHAPQFIKNYTGPQMTGYPETFVVNPQNNQVLTAFDGDPGAKVYTSSLKDAFQGKQPPYLQYSAAFNRYEDASSTNRNDEVAADALKEALNIATTNYGPTSEQAKNATFDLGDTYDRLIGDHLKAETFFRNAVKIQEADPQNYSDFDKQLSLYRLQLIYQNDGRFSDAISMIQQQAKLAPPDQAAEFQKQIDQLKAQEGNPAYQQYFSAVRAAETADTQQNYPAEIESRKAALKIATASFGASSPEAFRSTIDLGLAYQKSGDPQQAEETFKAALKILDAAPDKFETTDRNEVLFKRLEYLYERTGQYDKAITILKGGQAGADSETTAALQKWIDRLKAQQK